MFTNPLFDIASATTVTIDESKPPLGEGGFGRIFWLKESPNYVAKVLFQPTTQDEHEFFDYQVSVAPPARAHCAWPLRYFQLQDWFKPDPTNPTRFQPTHAGTPGALQMNVAVLVMRFVANSVPLSEFIHTNPRLRTDTGAGLFPHATYAHVVAAALKVAENVAAVHEESWIIGDMKPDNMRISKDLATVTLVDCDSWSNPYAPKNWAPAFGGPRTQPPEFYQKGARPTQESDRYQLGYSLFEILMLGFPPFPFGAGSRFPGNFQLPAGAPPLRLLPHPVQALCLRALSDNPQHRPHAREWIDPLRAMLS